MSQFMGGSISRLFGRRPEIKNPVFHNILSRQKAQTIQQNGDEAIGKAKQRQQDAEDARARALACLEDAEGATVRAERERERMAALEREAKEVDTEEVNIPKDTKKVHRETKKIHRGAERAMAAAKKEVEEAKRAADERCREAEANLARVEEMARVAAEETRRAMKAKDMAEKRLKNGIRPIVTPSPKEVAAVKRRIQYGKDCYHFAIAGVSGSGKSSLINAFRGLRNQAGVGVTETTPQLARYPDPDPENPYVWYDIPGAGTLKCRDWQYFNDQGLYAFDCIIVVIDNRFTMTDVAILINARRFHIPTYIVRSKADQHIRNMMIDMGYDEADVEGRNALHLAAREQFIAKTRKSVQTNLKDTNLPGQRVYIVSNTALLSITLNKIPKDTIDELELINDLVNEAYTRRTRRARSDKMVIADRDILEPRTLSL